MCCDAMKFLFSSSDGARLERIRRRAQASGIRCEIRFNLEEDEHLKVPSYPELWVQNDLDFQQAAGLLIKGLLAGDGHFTN